MIAAGKLNTLHILRESAVGLHLGDEEGNEALLPKSFIPVNYPQKGKVEVFVYPDSEGQLIATTKKPVVQIDHFACLRVKEITDFGAFMEWGLEKDLLVPFSEQKHKMEEDRFYVVRVYLDEYSNKIVGSSRLDQFVSNEDMKLEGGQEVEILITEESQLGFSCIINGLYKGLLYHNDIYQNLFIGDELSAYVKTIREDKLVDISLQIDGFKKVLSATDTIMDYLEAHDGYLDLHDKSSPEEIATKFSMSKATFKKSIGVLYRHRKVLIKPNGVYLVKEETENNPLGD